MNYKLAHTIDPALPIIPTRGEVISADPDLASWFQFDRSNAATLVGGKIATLSARAGSGALSQAVAGSRPTLESTAIAGYSVGRFNAQAMTAGAPLVNPSGTFTLAAIFRPMQISGDTEQAYFGFFEDYTHSILVVNLVGLNQVAVVLAPDSQQLTNIIPVDDKYHLLMVTVTPTHIKGSGDGVRKADVARTGASPGNGNFVVCSLDGTVSDWSGRADIADIFLFDRDLFADPDDEGRQAVYDYAKYMYGLAIA